MVTGASSGIGWELAKQFAQANCELIVVARREQKLSELAQEIQTEFGTEAHVIAMDLAEPNAAERLVEELHHRNLSVDVLVNNAGFGEHGRFAELPTQRQVNMIQLNVVTLTHLSRLLLPGMIERDRGGVLNVGSVAGFQPGPNLAVYYATKAYVLSFTDALHEELKDTNLHVTCLAPGPTHSGFAAESGMKNSRLFKMGAMSSKRVAQIGYRAFRKNRAVAVAGFSNKLMTILVRFVPRALVRKIVKWLQPV